MKSLSLIAANRCVGLLWYVISVALLVPAAQAITLAEVSEKALSANPDLQVFQYRSQRAKAQAETAALKPAYELALEAENFAGSGEFADFDNAEYTISLSSVVELGGKRNARLNAADSRMAQLQYQREAESLALLGRVNRAFIKLLALQEQQRVNQRATELAESSMQMVSLRVSRGAAPSAEKLRAQALLAEARLQLDATSAAIERQRFELANFWGGAPQEVGEADGRLFQFPRPETFADLWQQLDSAPVNQQLAATVRWREAELALAEADASSDLSWRLGVKQLQANNDTALVAGVAVPLFSRGRASGSINTAKAAREIAASEQRASLLQLRQRLHTAWSLQREYSQRALRIREYIIPALQQAAEQTKQAYQRGRYSYVDWVSAQRELYQAEINAIDAATEALANQTLIEQLTARPYGAEAVEKSLQE